MIETRLVQRASGKMRRNAQYLVKDGEVSIGGIEKPYHTAEYRAHSTTSNKEETFSSKELAESFIIQEDLDIKSFNNHAQSPPDSCFKDFYKIIWRNNDTNERHVIKRIEASSVQKAEDKAIEMLTNDGMEDVFEILEVARIVK